MKYPVGRRKKSVEMHMELLISILNLSTLLESHLVHAFRCLLASELRALHLRHRPVSERSRRSDDERVPVGEGGGDVPDEERFLRFRDADVEVIVPRNKAAVPDASVARWQSLIPSFLGLGQGGAIQGKEGIKFCSGV